MTDRAADDFETIRARMADIAVQRVYARRRCPHCDEAMTGEHAAGCQFHGVGTENETKPI